MAQKSLDQKVLIKVLPEGQTHVWQPCDMYAIAVIKRKVDRMWDEENEILWQTLPTDEAVHHACIKSLPVLKQRMYHFLAMSVDCLTEDIICAC